MHTSLSFLFRRFAPFIAGVAALGASAALSAQTTVVFDTRYQATNLSMWSGSTPTINNYYRFYGTEWDTSTGTIGGISRSVFGSFGLEFSAQISGRIGFEIMFKSTSGTMNIDLPNTISLNIPNLSGSNLGTIGVTQQRNFTAGANAISTTFPNAEIFLGVPIKVKASATGTIGWGNEWSGTTTLADIDTTLPLFGYNVGGSGKIQLLGGLFGLTEKNLNQGFTYPLNTDTFTALKSRAFRTAVEFGNISYTSIQLNGNSGTSLTSQVTQDEVIAIRANLLGLTTLALGLTLNPFEPKVYLGQTSLLAEATILSVDAGISLGLRQTITLQPQTRLVLQSNLPVTYEVDGVTYYNVTTLDVLLPDNPLAGETQIHSSVRIVSKPDDPNLQIYPSVYVSPIALSKVELGIAASIKIQALSIGLSAYGIGGSVGPVYQTTITSDAAYITLFNNVINLANKPQFTKRYRYLDSLVNSGLALGEDLAIDPYEFVGLTNRTQTFKTSTIAEGATLRLYLSGFNNTTNLALQEGATLWLQGAGSQANVRGLEVAASAKVIVDANSELHNLGKVDANGAAVLDANGLHTPGFVDAYGVLTSGSFELHGQLFYSGADIKTIGSAASLALIDNESIGNGTLHLLNGTNNPLLALENIYGALLLSGPDLALPRMLTLGGVLDLQGGSTVTANGLTGITSGGVNGTVLLDHGTLLDVRGGTFANITNAGVLEGINLILGDNTGGAQIRYTSDHDIVRNNTTIGLIGAAPTGGYLARGATGAGSEGLATMTSNTGSLTLLAGAQLTLNGSLATSQALIVSGADSRLTVNGALSNSSLLTVEAGQILAGGAFSNTGLFELANGGRLGAHSLGDLSTVNGVAHTLGGGGTWLIGGELIASNGAQIGGLDAGTTLTLRTPNAIVANWSNGAFVDAFSNFSSNAGTLTIREGATLFSHTAFSNLAGGNATVSGFATDGTNIAQSTFIARGLAVQAGTLTVGTYGILNTIGDTDALTSYWPGQTSFASSLPVNAAHELTGGTWNIGGSVFYTGAKLTGIAAGTSLALFAEAETLELSASTFNSNATGALFAHMTSGASPVTTAGLTGLGTIRGLLTLSPHATLRSDAATLTVRDGGALTLYPDATLHFTGTTLKTEGTGVIDLGGNLILGAAGQSTTFELPANFKFEHDSEIQLGRVVTTTDTNARYITSGTGHLTSTGAWTNEHAFIYGAGSIGGSNVINQGAIYAIDGTLSLLSGGYTNSGQIGSLRLGASSSTLAATNLVIDNFQRFTDTAGVMTTTQGLIDIQSNAALNNVLINGGNFLVGEQGHVTATNSSFNTDTFTSYGTLTLVGTTLISGDVMLGIGSQLTLSAAGNLTLLNGNSFINRGDLTIAGGAITSSASHPRTISNEGNLRLTGSGTTGFFTNGYSGTVTLANGVTQNFNFANYATPAEALAAAPTEFTNQGFIHLAPENPATTPNAAAAILFDQNTKLVGGGIIQLGGYIPATTSSSTPEAFWDNAGSGSISGSTPGFILTNFNQTIRGSGNIGGGVMEIINSAGGTIQAMGAGRTLVIAPNSAGFTNLGRLDVESGSTLRIDGAFNSFGLIDPAHPELGSAILTGDYRIAGTLRIPTVGSFDNSVAFFFDGPDAKIQDANGNTVSIKNNLATGSLTIGSGFNYVKNTSISDIFRNDGLLSIRTGSTFSILGGYFENYTYNLHTLNGGRWEILGGTLKFTGADLYTNNLSLTLGGANPRIVNELNQNALGNFSSNEAGGVLTFRGADGYTLPTSASSFTNAGLLAVTDQSTATFGTGIGTFTNTGTLTVNGQSTLTLPVNAFTNTGTLTLTQAGTLNVNTATAFNSGTISATDGATLAINATTSFTNTAPLTLSGNSVFNTPTFNNTGALTIAANANVALGSSITAFNNSGLIAVGTGATFTIPSSLTTFSGRTADGTTANTMRVANNGTLYLRSANVTGFTSTSDASGPGGIYQISGQLKLDTASLTHLGADLTLFGENARVVNTAGENALALTTVTANGKLTVANSAENFSLPLLLNNGTILVGSATAIDGAGVSKNVGGSLTLASASLKGDGLVKLHTTTDSPATLTLARATSGPFVLNTRIEGNGTIAGGGGTTQLIVDTGSTLTSSGGLLNVTTAVTNLGHVVVETGSKLHFLNNLSLNSGVFDINGELGLTGRLPTTLVAGGTFNLSGRDARVRISSPDFEGQAYDATSQNFFGTLATNYANLNVTNEATLGVSSYFRNYGNMSLTGAAILSTPGAHGFFENYGTLTLGQASFHALGWSNLGTVRINSYIGSLIQGYGDVRVFAGGNAALNFTNTYTGRTIIENGGFLSVVADNNLGLVPLTNVPANQLEIQSGGTLSLGAQAVLGNTRTVAYGDGATIQGGTILGPISGTGTLNVDHLTARFTTSGNINILSELSLLGNTRITGNITGAANTRLVIADAIPVELASDYTFGGTVDVQTALILGNGGTTGSFSNAILHNDYIFTVNRSGAMQLGRGVTGTGQLTLTGGVQATTGLENNYTGGLTINSGSSLTLTGGDIGAISNQGVFVFNPAANTTATAAIGGTGSITMSGAGTAIAKGIPVSGSAIAINSGTLQIGTGAENSGTFYTDISNQSALVFNHTGTLGLVGTLSGTGTLTKLGAGNLSVVGAQTYTGKTAITGGSLTVSADNQLGAAPAAFVADQLLLDGGTLILRDTFDLAATRGVTIGAAGGGVSSNFGATFTLATLLGGTGDFTTGGSVTAHLKLAAISDPRGYFATGGSTLVLHNQNQNTTVARPIVISDAGNVRFAGTGTTIVSGHSQIPTLGSLTVDAGSTASLYVNNAGSLYIEGTLKAGDDSALGFVSGSGLLHVTGYAGTATASRVAVANVTIDSGLLLETTHYTATGTTTLFNGGLRVTANDSAGSTNALFVNNGGVIHSTLPFRVTGSLDGTVGGTNQLNIGSGSTLQLENIGTVGNVAININAGSTLRTANTAPIVLGQIIGSAGNLFISGHAPAILNGPLHFSGDVTVGTLGTFQIGHGGTTGSYSGAITVQPNAFAGYGRSDDIVLTNLITGAGGLYQAGPGTLTVNTAQAFTGASKITGGTLRLADGGSLPGGVNTPEGGSPVPFGGAIIESGGTLRFDYFAQSATTFAGPISGNGTLVKDGNNDTVTLSGNNSFAGTTRVNTGTLVLSGANTGAGTINIGNGTTLRLIDGGTVAGTIANSGTLTLATTGDSTFASALTGNGTLYVTSTGTKTFTGAPTLAGAIEIASGASLAFDSALNGELSGQIRGAGSFAKGGTGTLILSGQNTFTGPITLNGGTLQIGSATTNSGTTGLLSGPVNIANSNAQLVFARSDLSGTNQVISGTGSVAQHGAGTFVLTADNTYTGGTTLATGATLQLGDGGTTGSILGNVANDGTLSFNHTNAISFGGISSGTGKISQLGTGTLTLTAQNTSTGGATIASGSTLALATTGSLAGPVTNNGTLSIATLAANGTLNMPVNVTGSGALAITGGGTLRITGGVSYTGQTTLFDGSTFSLSNTGTSTLTNRVAGTGNLQKLGTGTLILVSDNTFSGTTTIDQGTLQLGNGGTTGSLGGGIEPGSLVNNGTLAINRSDDLILNTTISGSGGLRQMGPGLLTLASGTNQFAGAFTIDTGASLRIGLGSGTAGTIAGAVIANGALQSTQSGTWALAGGLSGAGSVSRLGGELIYLSGPLNFTGTVSNPGGTVQIAGSGTMGSFVADHLQIQGNVALSGNTTNYTTTAISNGATLTLGAGATSGSLNGPIVNHGTLAVNRSDTFTLFTNGPTGVSGSGGFRQAGTGTTVLPDQYNVALEIAAGKLELNNLAGGDIVNNATLVLGTGGVAAGAISGTGGVDFNTSATLNGALTYSGATKLASGVTATINASSATTLAGGVSGAGNLTLTGTGGLTLNSATYTGTTTISGGTLTLKNDSSSSAFALASGAVLDLNVASGERFYSGSTTFSGTGTLLKTGTGAAIWGGSSATFNLGAGALIDVQAGAIYGGSNANENWTNNLAGLNVAAGAAFYGVEANVRVGALTGAGLIRSGFGDAGYEKFTFGAGNASGTFAGTLANTNASLRGHYVKIGTGNQTLSGTSTYTGSTTIAGGTLTLASSTALAPAPLYFVNQVGAIATLAIAANTNFASSQSIHTSDTGLSVLKFTNNSTATLGSAITGATPLYVQADVGVAGTAVVNVLPTNTGGLIAFSGTTLKLGNAAALNSSALHFDGGRLDLNGQTWSAPLDFSAANGGSVTNSATGAATLAGTVTLTPTAATGGTLHLGSTGGALNFTGSTAETSGVALVASGTGRVAATPTNSTAYTQLTTNGATLALAAPAAFSNVKELTATAGGSVEFGASATLALDHLTLNTSNLAGGGSGLSVLAGTSVRLDVSDRISFFGSNAGGSSLLLGGAGDLYLAGTMEGNANLAKIGLGKVTLDGDSTDWSGGIEVREGILAGAQALYNNRALNVLAGASAQLLGGGEVAIILTSLSGAGNVTIGSTGVLLDFNGATPTTHSGNISGAGLFTKAGTGQATLAGNFSAAGLVVKNGQLNLTGTFAANTALRVEGTADYSTLGVLEVPVAQVTTNGGATFIGNVEASGHFRLTGTTTNVTTNVGSITIIGEAAGVIADNHNFVGSLVTNASTGTLRVTDGGYAGVAFPGTDFTNQGAIEVSGANSSLQVNDPFPPAPGGNLTNFHQAAGTLTIGTGGKLQVRTLTISGGATVIDGRFESPAIRVEGRNVASGGIVQTGGTLTGSGTVYGSLTLSGGTFSPGNSPGTFTASSAVFNGGGNYLFEVSDAEGAAGTGYDLLSISGALTINATAANKFTFTLASLLAGGGSGNALNFNSAVNSSYTIASATGGIFGFDQSVFTLNTTGFTNPLNGGAWNLSHVGNNLNLNFAAASAIPEPSTYAAIFGALVLGLAIYRKRSRR